MKTLKILFTLTTFLTSSLALAQSNLADRVKTELERVGSVYLSCQDMAKLDAYGEAYNDYSLSFFMEGQDTEFSSVTVTKMEGQRLNPPLEMPLAISNLELGLFVFSTSRLKVETSSPETFRPKFNAEFSVDGTEDPIPLNCFISEASLGE